MGSITGVECLLMLPSHCQSNLIKPHSPDEADELLSVINKDFFLNYYFMGFKTFA